MSNIDLTSLENAVTDILIDKGKIENGQKVLTTSELADRCYAAFQEVLTVLRKQGQTNSILKQKIDDAGRYQ